MKIVVFDFDGTLTEKRGNLWRKIWQELGYDVGPSSYYFELLNDFLNGKIDYELWCELTCKAFQEKRFSKQMFLQMINEIKLMPGAKELIEQLSLKGVELHIVSGNFVSAIKNTLGESEKYITGIKANEFVFDQNGLLSEIVGTKYDFKGKARYIKELCDKKGINANEILFVGNSINDEWAYKSGAKTLCVNPDEADCQNSTIWNKVIYTDNLLDLEKEID